MNVVNTTEKNGTKIYHYKYSDLKEFLAYGFAHGNNGWIITKREGNLITYRGFGTIESPCRTLMTISLVYNPMFDCPVASKESYRFVMLDLSKTELTTSKINPI